MFNYYSIRLSWRRISYKKYIPGLSLFTLMLFALPSVCSAQKTPLKLWYRQPAAKWEESLPLGNGRLGMMADGGVSHEHIVLNDITLWSGANQDANNYDASRYLPQIRELLAEGKNDEAQAVIGQHFVCKGVGSAGPPFGCYQVLGNLNLQFNYHTSDTTAKNYHRELDLMRAIARTTYAVNGVSYQREYMTSFNSDVCVIRISASKARQINCVLSLSRPENAVTKASDGLLVMSGQLPSGTRVPGMRFLAKLKPVATDGNVSVEDDKIIVKNATELIIYVSAGTDFRQADLNIVDAKLRKASSEGLDRERSRHMAAFQRFFKRVDLRIGRDALSALPTDKRILNFQKQPDNDTALPVLFFQYGRYLSICSTRVGLLPPNLQGLWANQTQTPWNGDYHLDVNVEMNHWPLEVANLSELNLPLTDLVEQMSKNGERTAKAYYGATGWVAHVITNIWGFTEPGESASWGITKVGSGWLCNNLWQHYDFTLDRKYLQKIFPILEGAARFYNDMLIRDSSTGWLVTSPSSSPENSFYLPNGKTANICEGPTIDNQIIRELFSNVITAGRILHKDSLFCDTLSHKLKQLAPVGRVSKDSSLMEWLEDYKQVDTHHRHISHLYAVYPGNLITPDSTPELARACEKTLEARGDDGPGWSIAYKQLFWARLHDGNRAYKLFKALMTPRTKTDINYGAGGGIYMSMLSAGPPFQIDGNFGGTAGIEEMLLQGHDGCIELLPAIPDAWKGSGEVTGLKARGNITVSFRWVNGHVTWYKLTSASHKPVKLKVNGLLKTIYTTAG